MGYYRNFENSGQDNTSNLQGKTRKKVLAFTACFFISVFLWLIIAMNKNYNAKTSFSITTGNNTRVKITARIYGEGFDLLKEKFASHHVDLSGYKSKKSITDIEQLLRDSLELNSQLTYSHFKPSTIELNN